MAALPPPLLTIPVDKPAALATQHKADDGYHTPTSPPSQAKMICPPAPRKMKPRKRRRRRQLLEMPPEAISFSAEELDEVFRERTTPAAAVDPAPPPPPSFSYSGSAESETSTTNGGSCSSKKRKR